jgi:hypothetical protein
MVVLAAITAAGPLLDATPAFAAGSLQGAATITAAGGAAFAGNPSGDSATVFSLRLPTGASCPGDVGHGDKWSTYMVNGSTDPSTLTFNNGGPRNPSTLAQSSGATFYQPLYTPAGSPVSVQNPGSNPGGPGPIANISDVNLSVYVPGDVPAGVYNVGIACYLGAPSASQMTSYWNVQMTAATAAAGTGGPAQITWQNGTVPGAPTVTTLTPGTQNANNGQISVAFTNPAANPALTACTLFVGTTAGGTQFSGASGTSGTCTSPRVVTGLAYGQQYFVRMTSTNAVGTSTVSNELSATPVRPAVANLTATPSPNTVTLNWTAAPLLASGESYNIDTCTMPATNPCLPASAGHVNPTATSATNSYAFTGVAGQTYTFTVTYGAAGTSLGNSVQSIPLSNSILIQDLTVGRPNGALVLTQVCGKWDAMPAESGDQLGFPNGTLTASNASATGTAPTTGAAPGGPTDPVYSGYPYPDNPDGTANPTYPTHCGIDLGAAHLVTKGAPGTTGAGQFFAASGRLNQVTIVDTRDTDPGWTVNFTMSNLTSGPNSISGNELGWSAQKTDSPVFTDGTGFSYDQVVNYVNQSLAPNGQGPAGAGTAHAVIQAPDATPALGISTLDARLKLLIPIHAKNGTYTGTLTINAL